VEGPVLKLSVTFSCKNRRSASIKIKQSRSHFLGSRYWYVFPNYGRGVRKLYIGVASDSLARRQCFRLAYDSQYRKGPRYARCCLRAIMNATKRDPVCFVNRCITDCPAGRNRAFLKYRNEKINHNANHQTQTDTAEVQKTFLAFREQCIWLQISFNTVVMLDESGEKTSNILFQAASHFFTDPNHILPEYDYHQTCRLAFF